MPRVSAPRAGAYRHCLALRRTCAHVYHHGVATGTSGRPHQPQLQCTGGGELRTYTELASSWNKQHEDEEVCVRFKRAQAGFSPNRDNARLIFHSCKFYGRAIGPDQSHENISDLSPKGEIAMNSSEHAPQRRSVATGGDCCT